MIEGFSIYSHRGSVYLGYSRAGYSPVCVPQFSLSFIARILIV